MYSSRLELFLIVLAVASCTADKCWWQSSNICLNSTCNDVHHVAMSWASSNYSDKIHLFCPKHEAHDVVLCEDIMWGGQCYVVHIPKGQACANVDPEITNLAKYIHTLQDCIRIYDEVNCQGRTTFYPPDVYHYYQLEFQDMMTSVGLCSKEERQDRKCDWSNPEGRQLCPPKRCYWLDEPHCGESGSCGADHFMWIGSQNLSCRGQPTRFCCPKSNGHDVVLCQHFDLRGECVVIRIPNGYSCSNMVPIDSVWNSGWVSSVYSLEGCIKVYSGLDCKNLIKMFNKSTIGFNIPQKYNDEIFSFGLCSPEDQAEEECNQASPKGRSKCSPVTIKPPKMVNRTGSRRLRHLLKATIPGN